jgi:hypothetical protein
MSRYRRAMRKARWRAEEKAREAARPAVQRAPGPALRPIPGGVDVGPVDDDAKLEAIAELALRCLLCNSPEAVRLFFTPKDQRRAQAPKGKCRVCRYSLCAACYRDPTSLSRAEQRILADFDALARVN